MTKKSVGEETGHSQEIRSFSEDTSWVLPSCLIGVECEIEGLHKIPALSVRSYWYAAHDNSLREIGDLLSVELVTKFPLCGKDLSAALSEYSKIIMGAKSPPIFSARTSTHIHVDVRDISLDQLYRFIILYTIFERVLFKWVGEDRDSSNFCVPFYKAEGDIFESLSSDIENGLSDLYKVLSDRNRYAAFNLAALKKYGSVEFRHLHGTGDKEKIKTWINIIMSLKKYAVSSEEPLPDIPTNMSMCGHIPYLHKVFGEPLSRELIRHGTREHLLLGIRQAQPLVYDSVIAHVSEGVRSLIEKGRTGDTGLVDKFLNKQYPDSKLVKIKSTSRGAIPADAPDAQFIRVIHEFNVRERFNSILDDTTEATIERENE